MAGTQRGCHRVPLCPSAIFIIPAAGDPVAAVHERGVCVVVRRDMARRGSAVGLAEVWGKYCKGETTQEI